MIETSPKQQTVELIRDAKSILVATHKNPDGDALGSIVALKIALEKFGKEVLVVCPDKPNELFSFLPRFNEIETEVAPSRELVISLSTKNAAVDKIGYKKDIDRVDIVVTALRGKFTEEDVNVEPPKAKYDLIISVDTPNFERLGRLAQPADMFYEVPVINIDHHPSNERFGRVNWVELVATSTAEILVSLFEALGRETQLVDKDVATALLTGLIYDTSSFQNVNTTPKSLTVAAQLVAHGARQQEIIKNLYKTKSLQTLKLWGKVLSNVREDRNYRFLWSSVTRGDVEKVGADESALSGVIDELLKSATDVDFVMLLSERESQVHGSLRAIAKGINVSQIAESFGGGGHEVAAAFRIDGNLKEKENDILGKVRQLQSKSSSRPEIEAEKPEETVSSKPEQRPQGAIESKIEEKNAEEIAQVLTPEKTVGKVEPETLSEEKPFASPFLGEQESADKPDESDLRAKEERAKTKW